MNRKSLINSTVSSQSLIGLSVIFALFFLYILQKYYFFDGYFDDTYISLRYAKHFANGLGLVWNIGEKPIEGFTNLGWVVMVGGFTKLTGVDVFVAARFLGFVYAAATIVLATVSVKRLLNSADWIFASLLPIHLALMPFFARNALNGLETLPLAFFLICITYLWILISSGSTTIHWLLLALASFISFTLRMDSILYAFAGTAALIANPLFHNQARWQRGPIVFIVVLSTLIASLLLWKLAYFGSTIPLPAYMKFRPGLLFSFAFFRWMANVSLGFVQVVTPIIIYSVVGLVLLSDRTTIVSLATRSIAIGTAVYLLYFGAMLPVMNIAYRFQFPTYPSLAILGILGFAQIGKIISYKRTATRIAMAFLGILVIVTNLGLLNPVRDDASVWAQAHVTYGQLGRLLVNIPGLSCATSEAGQFPFYSNCRVLDIGGLNDAYIAKNRLKSDNFDAEYLRYLHDVFGLPDLYIDPNPENSYARMANLKDTERLYEKIKFHSLDLYLLNSSPRKAEVMRRLEMNESVIH